MVVGVFVVTQTNRDGDDNCLNYHGPNYDMTFADWLKVLGGIYFTGFSLVVLGTFFWGESNRRETACSMIVYAYLIGSKLLLCAWFLIGYEVMTKASPGNQPPLQDDDACGNRFTFFFYFGIFVLQCMGWLLFYGYLKNSIELQMQERNPDDNEHDEANNHIELV